MSDGVTGDFGALADLIDNLRQLGRFSQLAAPRVADALGREVRRTAAQGVSPDGTPWLPTQQGQRAMSGAARKIRTAVIGNSAIVAVDGAEALHHMGRARGGVIRQVIPNKFESGSAVRAVEAACRETFGEVWR